MCDYSWVSWYDTLTDNSVFPDAKSMGKYSIQGNEESKVASKIKRKLINEENSW